MEIINICQPVQSNLFTQLYQNIAIMLNAMGLFVRTIPGLHHKEPILIFKSRIKLPKCRQDIHLLFELTLGKRNGKLRIRLEKEEGYLEGVICSLVRSKREELVELICQINNLRLINSDYLLYLLVSTGQIGLQANINAVHFVTSQSKVTALLRSKISHAINVFSQELQNIIFYYKLPGISLHQYELEIQSYNQIPLQRTIEKISLLRELFQHKKQDKRQTPSPNSHPEQSSLLLVFSILNGPYNTYFPARQPDARSRTAYELEQEKKLLLNDIEKYQTLGFDPILTTIEIKQRIREKYLDSGGYSEIFSGIYSFIPQLSIHKETNDHINMKNFLKTGYHLVKKKGIHKKLEPSLRNQFNFLYYIRNKVCPYFAKYYCNNNILPFSDHELYLQYYPCSLADSTLRQKQRMKVIEDICMALLFLFQEGVIHRDLKEFNVMIDKRKRGRLIDFGSVSSSMGVNRFKPVDDKLRSTQGYFVPYSEAVLAVPSLSKSLSKSQYQNHRNFDQYSLGKIIHNQFYLDYIVSQNHLLRYNLKYLSQKCMEMNPQDRLSQVETIIFLRQLMHFDVLRSQFWKTGFDEHCRPHTFGRLQGQRQMRTQQNNLHIKHQ